MPVLQHVFVYGTLKRGQCRERCWPLVPTAGHPAWTFGELYDTGPFPALVAGSDRVAGELWSYEPSAITTVLKALDVIEGTNQPGCVNEYDRVLVDVFGTDEEHGPVRAYTYYYAQQQWLRSFRRLQPSVTWCGQYCTTWPPSSHSRING